ncbi:glycosyltransferase family 25 protein [Abyssogena phaseoliformis symbiont]|uniref:glycosyltransferase family 25 protein n=1 Tax=Abyssogena phaseoliformis symbiont TaxID=596095 RepID=UPI001914F2DB|nr:glycosyltransferase family 25 protein [Abyssogena phaseoliformis symbiont]
MSTTKIPIYIINLDRSPNRLSYMDKQLSKLKMPFERIVAIDGHQIQPQILQSYQQQSKRSWIHYAALSAGEIGYAFNWHHAWRTVSSHNSKACVVLENDVKIHDNIKKCN